MCSGRVWGFGETWKPPCPCNGSSPQRLVLLVGQDLVLNQRTCSNLTRVIQENETQREPGPQLVCRSWGQGRTPWG